VILPKQNMKNINEDLTPELRQEITVHLVSTIDEVLALALVPTSTDKIEHGRKKKDEGKSEVRSGRGYPPPSLA
jgi:predicted ATP-dependent protease